MSKASDSKSNELLNFGQRKNLSDYQVHIMCHVRPWRILYHCLFSVWYRVLVNGSRCIIGLFNAWFTHTTQRKAQASYENMTVNESNERQIIAPACVARAFTCVVGEFGYYSFFVHVRLHVLIKCSLSVSCRFLFQCDWLINLQSVPSGPQLDFRTRRSKFERRRR